MTNLPKAVWFSVLLLVAGSAGAVEVDLTRHLVKPGPDTPPGQRVQTFFGVPGEARLLISGLDETVGIVLNEEVIDRASADAVLAVTLREANTLILDFPVSPGAPAEIRVKQTADIDLNVESFIHFNTNVSDFSAARAFYGLLGFDTISEFPDTNTQAMARAIGINTPTEYDGSQGGEVGGYLLHGEIIGPAGFFGGVIDLIEFTIPRNDDPPYEKVNRLGMARGAMLTTDLDADYQYMKSQGVDLLSKPVTRSDGTRFLMFRDLDGTLYELIEDGEQADDAAPTETTHIHKMAFVNVNVSDYERSRAWYQMFGYEVSRSLAVTDSQEVAMAMGLDEPYRIEGAMLAHQRDGSVIELVQWHAPYDATPPYPIPINHLGIHRMALATTDIEADVAALKAQGVEFISPITPCCSGEDASSSIVAFYDPDGTIVELAQMPYIFKFLGPVIRWFMTTFGD